MIRGLIDGDGKTSKVGIERLVTAYFKSIFATSSPSGFAEALEGISTVVTEDMNRLLDMETSYEEIRTILFQMHPTKAPCIDSFHALFF